MTEIEKYVLDYFGMQELATTENTIINTDYGQLVNLLTMYVESQEANPFTDLDNKFD